MLKIDLDAEKVVKSYVKALASSAPHNWKGFYDKKSSSRLLFRWPLFHPVRGYEFKEQTIGGTREHFQREDDSKNYTHIDQEKCQLYNFDIMNDLEKIWERDAEKNTSFQYGALINGLEGYLNPANDKTEEGAITCLITSEAKRIVIEKVKAIMDARSMDLSCLNTDVTMLHPVNWTFSLWAVRNLRSSLNTREYKAQIMKCIHEVDVQVDAVSAMAGVDRQLDAARVIVFPLTSFNDKNLVQAMKTIKMEKDDKGKPIISLMKEHPIHKGVWSFRINKFSASKKHNFNPSKMTNEHACILLSKEAFKRLRSPLQILDYLKPVIPTSSAFRQRVSPEIYKTLLGIFVSMAQQTRFFNFGDYVKNQRDFSDGKHNVRVYNFKDTREDYVPDRIVNSDASQIPLSEEQKKAVGLAMRGYEQHQFVFIQGARGTGKTTCLKTHITHLLTKTRGQACVYINLRTNRDDAPNITAQMNGHELFVNIDLSKTSLLQTLANPTGLEDLVKRASYDENLGVSLPTFVAYGNINQVNYFFDNYEHDVDREAYESIIAPLMELDETWGVWVTSSQISSPDSKKFHLHQLTCRLRGTLQINQACAELSKEDMGSRSLKFNTLDTYTFFGQDVELLAYTEKKSMADVVNKLILLMTDKTRSFGATANAPDILVSTTCPPLLTLQQTYNTQRTLIQDQCNFETIQFWDMAEERGWRERRTNEVGIEGNCGRIKSEYPVIVIGILAENLAQIRTDVRDGNKIAWVAKVCDILMGKAMAHIVVVASEEVIREVRHAIYPPDYADKGFGVKFARALMNGF